MDAIRTLLLARTHVVVLDADLAASAATRPSRDSDLDKFEDELAQLGFVMSLDLAITIRRLPHQAIRELRTWMFDTLAKTTGAQHPHVPLFRAFPQGTHGDTSGLYLRRVLTWLLTRADQPCPWCAQIESVGALDPCGHLVCRRCWDGGNYAGCPICHRRVTPGHPFVRPRAPSQGEPSTELVIRHDGQLRLLHLAFDLAGTARARFEQLMSRATPLSPEDRAEVETVIDTLGPRAASWLPTNIAVKETMAVAVARLWLVSPDRQAMLQATAGHLRTATDVLRVATVLMGGNAGLVIDKAAPIKLASLPRGLRRVVLEALDRIPADQLVEDVQRHPAMWKRIGERLHPFEHAKRLPTAALAFAVVRGTKVSAVSFGSALQAQTTAIPRARIERDRVRVTSWGGMIEDGLRAGRVLEVAEHLAQRPGELLRRADHLVRRTQDRQPEALGAVLDAIRAATSRGAPAMLLTLASHVARRGTGGHRRVFVPDREVRKAWSCADDRMPLRADAIGAITSSISSELLRRAESKPRFARAMLDRGLVDLLVPLRGHRAAPAHTAAGPTLWDVACIHAASRANLVYVRERDGSITQYRRREGETTVARLGRLHGATDNEGTLPAIPPANAPTWFALLDDTLALPTGSEGYFLDARTATGVTRLAASDLVAQLAPRP
ncbi:MAG: hypothetical protein JWP01_3060 [Myxococcales bacterium]|nr:hypothetical protein [Myxococcales bacterium]